MFDFDLPWFPRFELPATDQLTNPSKIISTVDAKGHGCPRLKGIRFGLDPILPRHLKADAHVVTLRGVRAVVKDHELVLISFYGIAPTSQLPFEPHLEVGMIGVIDHAWLGVWSRP